jgi:hypothetical protein
MALIHSHYFNIKITLLKAKLFIYIGLINKKIYFCAKYRYHKL